MRKLSVTLLLILGFSVFFATATRASEKLPLTTLVLRDHKITINTTPNGFAYTVIRASDGTVLDAQLNDTQLQAKYPEIYDAVRPSMADGKETNDATVWGGTQHVPANALPK
ncbi:MULTISPECIES: hypothetical protein [Nostocales]|uniref:Uncharacterized protein n=3 Tax=Nostocales TaxID=1161 RepID=A0A0C1R2Y6_9CYAN|nr:hypothetical protein [Tolypothrix bouteillei]KAF3886091.1 hypothetical protein DA73_0400011880 [Tolypothrix bouteillei VB521301]